MSLRSIGVFIGSLLFLLGFVVIYRAYIVFQPCKHSLEIISNEKRIKLSEELLNRFQKALQFETVTYGMNRQNLSAIDEFVRFARNEFIELEKYPFVKYELVNNRSILYKVSGSDKSLKPYLLAAHFDVVPANRVNDNWSFEPFKGVINEGFIYGRGALDDKASMLSQLEALKVLLRRQGQPKRTLYLAYGHDEESAGHEGAGKIADFINEPLEYVLDEGTMIIEDLFPELNRPVAYISIAEKGYLTLKFSVNTTGGHSSMPKFKDSAIYILSQAINKLETQRVPSMFGLGPEKSILEKLSVHFGFIKRILFSNIWLFKPVLEYAFSLSPTTDALQRTTSAVTIFQGGVKENVIPSYAEFTVNHRIHSKQSCAEIIDYDLKVINDERVKYEVLDCTEPSHVSSINSDGYSIIKHTTQQLFPDAIPIPGVMLGLTDSRYYSTLTKNIYKYLPIRLKNDDLKRYHGKDERISLQNYEDCVNFYFNLMRNSDNADLYKQNIQHLEL